MFTAVNLQYLPLETIQGNSGKWVIKRIQNGKLSTVRKYKILHDVVTICVGIGYTICVEIDHLKKSKERSIINVFSHIDIQRNKVCK